MIQDIDETLRTLIRREALEGTDIEVVLDAPTKEWSARRNAPTLDLYLYDIREDLRRRENGLIDLVDDTGRVTERVKPPRWYKLSYLVTAWTQRPEDEHRLLAAVLACFLLHDYLPLDALAGQLSGLTLPIPVTVGLPPPEDRALSDVWSALGGELKPSLDLVVISPFDTRQFEVAAPEVREGLRLRVGGQDPDGEARATSAARRRRLVTAGSEQDDQARGPRWRPAGEVVVAGSEGRPGRTLWLRQMSDGRLVGETGGEAPWAADRPSAEDPTPPSEVRRAGPAPSDGNLSADPAPGVGPPQRM